MDQRDGQPLTVRTLILTGTTGAGKSTVAAEINDALAALEVPNAAVDLDALVWQWPSTSAWNDDLLYENLSSIWPNYAARGVRHLILARVVEQRDELDRYRAAVPGAEITVCRIVAPQALRLDRLHGRMPPGPSRDWHLDRSIELEAILRERAIEDFTVENGERPVRVVALDVLRTAGWITAEQAATAIASGGDA